MLNRFRHRTRPALSFTRPLRLERLESRQMLSITVDTLVDENNGVGVGAGTSLHEAILAAAPSDTINFSVTGTINLVSYLPTINKNLTIAGPGRDLLTIKGGGTILSIGDNKDQVLLDDFISGLTLTGATRSGISTTENLTISDCAISNCSTPSGGDGGGGIYSFAGKFGALPNTLTVRNTILSGDTAANTEGAAIRKRYGTLVVDGCTITGNTAYWAGAGISVADGDVQAHITNSVISNNTVTNTNGAGGYGSGIFIYNGGLDISHSVISGNTAPSGGGINASRSDLSIVDSIVSGNTATGTSASAGSGGGIWAPNYGLTLLRSTVDGNSAPKGNGGGISAGYLSAVDNTISANSAAMGGGVYLNSVRDNPIRNCTISGNSTTAGGAALFNGYHSVFRISNSTITANVSPAHTTSRIPAAVSGDAILTSSIIAGNINGDLAGVINSGGYNIVGTGAITNFNRPGDQTGITNPMLGPLTDNGGPTKTQMPLAGSPAINAGNPAFNPANPDGLSTTNDATPNDQRGAPFARIYVGRIDIGAVERQPINAIAVGDFDHDGTVGIGDYLVWRVANGTSTTPFTGADASGNGIVDAADYAIWRAHYGYVIPLVDGPGSGSSQSLATSAAEDTAVATVPAASQPTLSFVEAMPSTSPASKPLHFALAPRSTAMSSVDSATLNLMALRAPYLKAAKTVRPLDDTDPQSSDPDSHHCAAFATLVAEFARIQH
jgi:hypothetical protein